MSDDPSEGPGGGEPLYLKTTAQFKALSHPQRHDIVATLLNRGASTIREIAEEMGCTPTSLYRHMTRLEAAGIVTESGRQPGPRRDAVLYKVPGSTVRSWQIPADEEFRELAARDMRLEMRSVERDLEKQIMESEGPDAWRKDRSLRFMRAAGWLDRGQVEEMNELMNRIEQLLQNSPKREGTKRYKLIVAYREQYSKDSGESPD